MKILIMTPFWKRPEIVKEYLRSLERLPKHDLLAILSPEDPNYWDIMDMLPEGAYVCSIQNSPFGRKKNEGAELAAVLEWDYLMELNSDSIVNPAIFELYKPYMDKRTEFFGLNNLFAVDYATKRSIFCRNYNTDMTFGSGRMLHRSALHLPLWTNELESGMDTNMMSRLKKHGVKETVVDCGETPMIVDLKTNTTLSHFKILERYSEKTVPYEYICKHIGYDIIT